MSNRPVLCDGRAEQHHEDEPEQIADRELNLHGRQGLVQMIVTNAIGSLGEATGMRGACRPIV
jgi:purine nucleoside phosphorylase